MKNKLIAKCQSLRCNEKFVSNRNGIIKNVSLQTIDCPDCGASLLWTNGLNRKPARSSEKLNKSKMNKDSKTEFFI